MKANYITKSIEKISHFNCGSCGKWWSIGDAPTVRKSWFCSWCGLKQSVGKVLSPKHVQKNLTDS